MGFKENVKRHREARGWTQSYTAQLARVPLRSYQNWENGGREPRLDALVRLAAAFGVTPNELLEGIGAEPPADPQPAVELRPRPVISKRK